LFFFLTSLCPSFFPFFLPPFVCFHDIQDRDGSVSYAEFMAFAYGNSDSNNGGNGGSLSLLTGEQLTIAGQRFRVLLLRMAAGADNSDAASGTANSVDGREDEKQQLRDVLGGFDDGDGSITEREFAELLAKVHFSVVGVGGGGDGSGTGDASSTGGGNENEEARPGDVDVHARALWNSICRDGDSGGDGDGGNGGTGSVAVPIDSLIRWVLRERE
jgi:hypothetical protein